jgi:diguanylate cyclase (GGDEF)-like protein/PAS domain S-box-containing protein
LTFGVVTSELPVAERRNHAQNQRIVPMRTRLLQIAAQFLVTGITTWALMVWLGGARHLLYVWPLTAIQLAIVLGSWRSPVDRFLQLAAGACGELIACAVVGIPLWIGFALSLNQAAEVWCAGMILSRSVTRFDDLKRRVHVLRLGVTALLVPIVFIGIAAKPVSVLTHHSMFSTWKIVMPSDTLGLAVVLPALLFLLSGEYRSFHKLRPHLMAAGPSLALFLAAAIAIFAQTSNPFVFLIFPPLILVVFALGLEGAVFALPALTVIACVATAYDHGPIWLKAGTNPERRIFVLQIFLCTVAAIALSVGALLDEQRKAGRAAEEAQSIYQTLIQNVEDMIILSSLDGTRRFVSPAVQEITGWTPDEFVALKHLGAIHPADRDLAQTIHASLAKGKMNHTFRYRAVCRDGGFRWVEACVRGYRDSRSGAVAGYVATVRDISAQKQTEDSWLAERAVLTQENQYLADLASKDPLTGIPNRRAFDLVLEHEVARHTRSEKSLSLLMIDVDHFKKYNDLYGHPAGDLCLQQLAQALQSCIGRVSDIVARLGGEEFAVLLPVTDEAGACKLAESMLDAVRNLNLEHADSPLGRVSVSIGIATWPPYFTAETAFLIQQADRALYESKRLGRNTVSVNEDHSAILSSGRYWDLQ